MKIGPLTLLSRTSDRKTVNLASWHSPHSLTWRWIMSLRRHPIAWPKPYAHRNSVGFGAGLGTLLSFHAYRTNGGWQWGLCALWHGLHFSQQRPMWYRDMFARADAERSTLRSAANIEALCQSEFREGVSPGAAARQMCRSLPAGSALRTMLEAMLAKANRASFDRSCILRAFADADPEAAAQAESESFHRINGLPTPGSEAASEGMRLN